MSNLPQAGPLATFGILAGPRYGDEIAVPKPVVTLGRGTGCDVVIDDDSVSAQHARLEFDLGAWRITDLGSTNGTAVEGVKLAPEVPTPLPYGASVRLGGVRLQFRAVEEADPAAAREAYVPPAERRTLKEERTGFRFPVWLAVLVLVLIAALLFAVLNLDPSDAGRQPVPVPAGSSAPPAAQAAP